ncbi:MAG TPA: SDR family NAD(P)-dependent oxidoreductase [Treponemataceae bacterium]|nr:SDR family NAD(P)-dependent oxidoreductase [Treponemataceae bacterium]
MKRIIIVTGASSGIGKEFALQLAAGREADEIWLLARRKDRLEALIPAISAFGKATPRAIAIDLGGKRGVDAFTDLLAEERTSCGNEGFIVDALVNNAGFGTYGKFAATDAERELEMIDLNVYALTGLCHAALPFLRKGSVIINVASLAGFSPLGNLAVYAATKAYVLSFSVALAAELADSGVFVSTVCPGPVDTEFSLVASGGVREKVVDGKSPEALVRHALRSIKSGKRIAIMAPKWKFKAFMSRFVGRFAIALHSSRHDTRPAAPRQSDKETT